MLTQQTAEQATGAGIALPVAASTLMAGADPLGLLLGMIAATLVTFLLGSVDNRWKAIAGILFAAMLSGFATPAVAAGILHRWPDWKPVMDLAHPLMSIIIGGAAPTIVPAFQRAGATGRPDWRG